MPKQQVVSYIDNIDVFRVNCLLHADIVRNKATVIIGGTQSSWTLAGALDYLMTCTEAVRNASRQMSKRRAAAKLLVFCTELDVMRALISDKLEVVGEIGDKVKYAKHYRNYIATANILFANANVIVNNTPAKVHEMLQRECVAQSVAQLLDSMSDDWTRIRWSLAHHTQSKFYRSLRSVLWSDMLMRESAYYFTADIYNEMLIGNKSGALARFDGSGGRYQRQVLTNIISIDKRSAYPSVMVNDWMYPLRMIELVKKDRVQALGECITQRRWCKLVIHARWPELDLWYDEDAGAIGMDICDIMLCFKMQHGPQLMRALECTVWNLYRSTDLTWRDKYEDMPDAVTDPDGYLNADLRDSIVHLYEHKEQLDRSDPVRHMEKTQIDMLCGKGLQRWPCSNTRALNRGLRGRGERYLRPQHSMHTIAAVRLELYTLAQRIMDACDMKAVIAFDTDGIKVKDSRLAREIIEAHNADIMQRNQAAGVNSNIGTWCIEYKAKRFLQIGTKQYVYIDDQTGELITKSAGIPKLDLIHAIKGLNMEPMAAIEYIAKHKIPVDRRAGFVYDPETQLFIERRETVMF